MDKQTVFKGTNVYGETCHFGVAGAARIWAGKRGRVERIEINGRECSLNVVGRQQDELGRQIDENYAGRLALLLECMLVDPDGSWNDAAVLLEEYKAAWEKVNPSPPAFMGEPMPPERKAWLQGRKAQRAAASLAEKGEGGE